VPLKHVYFAVSVALTAIGGAALAQPGPATAPVPAAPFPPPAGFIHLSAREIQDRVGHADPSGAVVSQYIDRHEYYNAQIAARSADGTVERHDHWIDFDVIDQGEVTLTVGGVQAGNTVDANGESHGGTQTGGTTMVLHAGDYVQVPAGMPHTMTNPKNLIYTIVKVRD